MEREVLEDTGRQELLRGLERLEDLQTLGRSSRARRVNHAEARKARGNACFKAKDLDGAILAYLGARPRPANNFCLSSPLPPVCVCVCVCVKPPVARRRALAPARGADAGGHAARFWLLSARRGGGGAPRAQGRGAAPGLRGRRDGGARRGPRPVAPRQPVHGRAQGRGPRARLSAPASDARRARPITGRAPLGWPGPRRRRSGSPRGAPPRTGTRRRTVPKTTTGVDQTSYFSVVRRADVVSAGRVVFLPSSPLRGGPPLLLKAT